MKILKGNICRALNVKSWTQKKKKRKNHELSAKLFLKTKTVFITKYHTVEPKWDTNLSKKVFLLTTWSIWGGGCSPQILMKYKIWVGDGSGQYSLQMENQGFGFLCPWWLFFSVGKKIYCGKNKHETHSQ